MQLAKAAPSQFVLPHPTAAAGTTVVKRCASHCRRANEIAELGERHSRIALTAAATQTLPPGSRPTACSAGIPGSATESGTAEHATESRGNGHNGHVCAVVLAPKSEF
jgi:hypothetical protein